MRTFEQIAEETMHIKVEHLKDSLTPKDVPDWDSINYLLFIAELEKEYDFSFTMDEVTGAQCFGDIRRIVEQRKK